MVGFLTNNLDLYQYQIIDNMISFVDIHHQLKKHDNDFVLAGLLLSKILRKIKLLKGSKLNVWVGNESPYLKEYNFDFKVWELYISQEKFLEIQLDCSSIMKLIKNELVSRLKEDGYDVEFIDSELDTLLESNTEYKASIIKRVESSEYLTKAELNIAISNKEFILELKVKQPKQKGKIYEIAKLTPTRLLFLYNRLFNQLEIKQDSILIWDLNRECNLEYFINEQSYRCNFVSNDPDLRRFYECLGSKVSEIELISILK